MGVSAYLCIAAMAEFTTRVAVGTTLSDGPAQNQAIGIIATDSYTKVALIIQKRAPKNRRPI